MAHASQTAPSKSRNPRPRCDIPPRRGARADSIDAPSLVLAAPIDDAQILEVLHAANVGEINAGKLAASKAQGADVVAFAKSMVDDHATADKNGRELAAKLHLRPKPSQTSKKITTDADTDGRNIKAATAEDVDRVYMDAMVAGHTGVLSTIDTQLIPAAKAPELQAMLKEARAMVAHHLERAKAIRAGVK